MTKNNWLKRLPDSIMSAIVFFVSSVFSRGIAIITTPIFTRLMSPADIGTVTTFTSWYSLLLTVSTLSLTSGGYTIGLKEYEHDRNGYDSSVLFLTSCSAVVLTLMYFSMPSFWQKILGMDNILIILMLVGFLVEPAKNIWMARQRYEYKYKLLGIVNIGGALLAALLSVICVQHNFLNEKATSRLVGNYSILFSIAFIIWICIFVRGKNPINTGYWKFSLQLSIPLIGYAFASQILSVSDRIMIDQLVGKREAGIYGIIYTVGSLSLMVWSAVNGSFEPYLYQKFDKNNNKIKEISSIILSLYALLEVALVLCAPEIVKMLATEEYYEAIYLMPPIAAGVFFTSVSNMYSDILVYLKKTNMIMISAVVAAGLNVFLNYIFIRRFGYVAAAYTTLFTYVIMSIGLFIGANSLYKKTYGKKLQVYSNMMVMLISSITIILSLTCSFLYRFTVLRWICVFILLVFAFFFLKLWRKIRHLAKV